MKTISIKNSLFVLLCAVITFGNASQVTLFTDLSMDIIFTITLFDIKVMCLLKRTCAEYNNFLDYKDILMTADTKICEHALEYFWNNKNIQKFNLFLQNNEEGRKRAFITLLNQHIQAPCTLLEEHDAQKSIHEIWLMAKDKKEISWSCLVDNPVFLRIIACSDNPNLYDYDGKTLFSWVCNTHCCAGQKQLEIDQALHMITMFLENSATDVNACDNDVHAAPGYQINATGFMKACYYGNLDMVQLLLQQNKRVIDFNIKNKQNHTAFTWIAQSAPCNEHHTKEILQLLIKDDRVSKDYEVLFKNPTMNNIVQDLLAQEKKDQNIDSSYTQPLTIAYELYKEDSHS